MRAHVPDGTEVAATLDADAAQPPLLVLDRLTDYLDSQGIGAGPVSWERIGDGQSNVTYRLWRGDVSVVLRRGPRPPHPPSTHDMVREATIQSALRPSGVQVPEIIAVCDDIDVLGVPFYLMSWIDGVVITDHLPAVVAGDGDSPGIGRRMMQALAGLHAVDVSTGPVSQLGRPSGYLERQVRRFASLWDVNATRTLPEVERIGAWLEANRPDSQAAAVVHGDYRLGNLMFAPASPARVVAVLDWEMATLGDPLADLGYVTATYSEPGGVETPLHLSPVTAGGGFLAREELVREYAAFSALDLSALGWYQTLALWKAAIFCEAIYARWLNGERPGDRFGPTLEAGVPALLAAASRHS